MAMSSLRLRRAISTLRRPLAAAAAPAASSAPSSSPSFYGPSPPVQPQSRSLILQSRAFRSSPASLLGFGSSQGGGGGGLDNEIGPDTILFEGCDYNHWLIVMDFPKDNKPLPEEMIRTYEETCAKGLDISIEEAKLKMYACSTTTYTGFQAVMTEEESEKFNGLPGVVFVLPDSYIDPQNKEYGGDKYENGKITHRPPPVQYGRSNGRYRDQPRYDRPRGPMPNQEGNPQYGGHQGPMQGGPMPNQQARPSYGQQGRPMQGGGGAYGAPQNYPPPQQNYGPPPGGRIPYQQGSGGPAPPYHGNYNQGNYNQGGHGNFNPREQREFQQGDQRNYAPPPARQQSGFRDDHRNYGQGAGGHGQGGFGQGAGGHQGQGGFGQGAGGHQVQGGLGQGAGGHQGPGGLGQGAGGHQSQGGFGQGTQGQPSYYPPGNDQGRY